MPLTLDEVLARAGATKYNAPPFIQTGANDGYLIHFSTEPAPEPPGMGRTEWGTPAWNGYGLSTDGFSGKWYYNPSGIDAIAVPEAVQNYLQGYGRSYASSVTYIPNWAQALKNADNGGGWVEAVASIGLAAAVSAAAWNLAGSLSTDGFSLGAEATEEITVSMTETQGASTVGETGLEWYSVDPGPDPFATTADVNAGWSFDGGYPGVDWYNSAGIGEAAASNSLDSILGSINKVSSTVNTAIRALSGTAAQVRNNLATPAPNYTRAAGGINLGLLAVGLLAWKLL